MSAFFVWTPFCSFLCESKCSINTPAQKQIYKSATWMFSSHFHHMEPQLRLSLQQHGGALSSKNAFFMLFLKCWMKKKLSQNVSNYVPSGPIRLCQLLYDKCGGVALLCACFVLVAFELWTVVCVPRRTQHDTHSCKTQQGFNSQLWSLCFFFFFSPQKHLLRNQITTLFPAGPWTHLKFIFKFTLFTQRHMFVLI